MTSDAHEYEYVDLGPAGARRTRYVVDTNVISHVESMLRSGEREEPTVQQQKAAHLARVVAEAPDAQIIDDFALFEGSSFHDPRGLKAQSLVLRDAAYSMLRASGGNLLHAVADLTAFKVPDGFDADIARQLDDTLNLMVRGMVPAYVAALTLEKRYGPAHVNRLDEADVLAVLGQLSTTLGYIPGTLWMTLLLASCGDTDSCQAAMGVLKTGRQTGKPKTYRPDRNALSAAWDLGALQGLSEGNLVDVRSILVTEDKALANLVRCMQVEGHALCFKADALSSSPAHQELQGRLQSAYANDLTKRTPQPPTRRVAADAVEAVELAIGLKTTLARALREKVLVRVVPMDFCDLDLTDLREIVVAPQFDSVESGPLATWLVADGSSLPGRLHAAIRMTNAMTEEVAERLDASPLDALRAAIAASEDQPSAEPALDENTIGIIAAVRGISRRGEAVLAAAAYYDLLVRNDKLHIRVLTLAALARTLARRWAAQLDLDVGTLFDAAAQRLGPMTPLPSTPR